MCLPANATTNRGEHYWLVLGWHEILSCIWHKQSLLADICIVFVTFSIPGSDNWLSYQSDIAAFFFCSRKKHFEFKGISLIRFIRNQEICLMSSQISHSRPECDIAPRIWHGGGQRMSPASPGVPWPRSESPEAAQCLGSQSGEIGSVPVQTPWSQSQRAGIIKGEI